MTDVLKNLKNIIGKSELSSEDQNDLLIFLPILPTPVLVELNKVFETKPKLLQEFNENFKAKVAALSGERNGDAWNRIIEQETETLRRIDRNEDEEDEYDY